MASRGKIIEARKAWVEYGNALATSFGLPEDSQFAADDFEAFIKGAPDDRLIALVAYVRDAAAKLR